MDTLFSDPTANTNYEPDQYRTIFTTQNLRLFLNPGRSWLDQNGPQRLKTYFTHIKIEYNFFLLAINY